MTGQEQNEVKEVVQAWSKKEEKRQKVGGLSKPQKYQKPKTSPFILNLNTFLVMKTAIDAPRNKNMPNENGL